MGSPAGKEIPPGGPLKQLERCLVLTPLGGTATNVSPNLLPQRINVSCTLSPNNIPSHVSFVGSDQ